MDCMGPLLSAAEALGILQRKEGKERNGLMEDEHVFQSCLSEEKTARNFQGVDVFAKIMEGLEEALAYERGGAEAVPGVRVRWRSTEDPDALQPEEET